MRTSLFIWLMPHEHDLLLEEKATSSLLLYLQLKAFDILSSASVACGTRLCATSAAGSRHGANLTALRCGATLLPIYLLSRILLGGHQEEEEEEQARHLSFILLLPYFLLCNICNCVLRQLF